MNCFFDPENNFKLTISASFYPMNRHPNIVDERKFTMITGETWNKYYDPPESVQIFDSSSCIGEEQNGIVKFEEMVLKITRNMNNYYLIFSSDIKKYF